MASQTPLMKKKEDRREKESLKSVIAADSEPGRENETISEPSRYNAQKHRVSMDLTEQVNKQTILCISSLPKVRLI